MKWVLVLVVGVVIGVGGVLGWGQINKPKKAEIIKEYPLLKYTIENLGKREYGSQILLDNEVKPGVYKFHFDSDGKNVTGLAHIPNSCTNKCPVVAQFRGYADPMVYYSGYGTEHSAQEFAKAGFISLAPDFLGYGGSASPSANIWEARFETCTTALNFLAGVEKWDKTEKIGIWGHSNGGQIALTTLEISGKEFPAVLWAPVSAGFPYSILYYMDDNSKGDRDLRKSLVEFENDYDSGLFNLLNFTDRIKAPILLQQGSADISVPQRWSDSLVRKLTDKEVDVKYEVYPGADHNLTPGWSNVVKSDIDFYKKYLK
jgi:dipeptidyl aminopeptidase/acylaminoacyl peptidase